MTPRRIQLFCLLLIALFWLGYAAGGRWVAARLSVHWGAKIQAAAEGNVSDAKLFVQHRLFDGVLLVTVAAGLVLAQSVLVARLLKRYSGRDARWIFNALAGFIAVNVWLAVAIHTTLFWALFWQG